MTAPQLDDPNKPISASRVVDLCAKAYQRGGRDALDSVLEGLQLTSQIIASLDNVTPEARQHAAAGIETLTAARDAMFPEGAVKI